MASPKRSVNNELHIGATEGSHQMIGKDWGGPQDLRSCPPLPPCEEDTTESGLLDRR
jgi:hypothetical protein